MREPRASYTPDEDAIVLSIVKEAIDEGLPLATGYLKAADELGRPVGSVSNRHRRLINPNKDASTKKTDKVLSEGEKLALRLKALKRDRERSSEKSEMFKERFTDLEKEYTTLKKKYDALSIEHANLIKTVSDVLGES
jgi:hypothetical protein